MNWKDTVMSPKKIRRLWSTPNILGEANLAIAQAQAEISFRAGQKAERGRIIKLLPEIAARFDHNKTCFDCVENIRRQALKGDKL